MPTARCSTREATTVRSPRRATKSSSCLPRLENAHVQQQRPPDKRANKRGWKSLKKIKRDWVWGQPQPVVRHAWSRVQARGSLGVWLQLCSSGLLPLTWVRLGPPAFCHDACPSFLHCWAPLVTFQHYFGSFTSRMYLFWPFDRALGRKEGRCGLYLCFQLKAFLDHCEWQGSWTSPTVGVLSFHWKNCLTLSKNWEEIKWAHSSKFVSSIYLSFCFM